MEMTPKEFFDKSILSKGCYSASAEEAIDKIILEDTALPSDTACNNNSVMSKPVPDPRSNSTMAVKDMIRKLSPLLNSGLFSGYSSTAAYSQTTLSSILSLLEDEEEDKWICNNPYGDGSDPEYVCWYYKDGYCGNSCSCKEKYIDKELDD